MTAIGCWDLGLEGNPGPQPTRMREVFGEGEFPRLFYAPGRVNLMGAHLDYNGGPVMPMAIDRGTWVAARCTKDGQLRLSADCEGGAGDFPARTWAVKERPRAPSGQWYDYPLGVLRAIELERGELPGGGLTLDVGGNLPIGAGLSSSASLCLATVEACDALWELEATAQDKIRWALFAEREFVGTPCGIMDPFAIALARRDQLLWLECGRARYEHLPFDSQRLGVAVADSGVRRRLNDVAYGERVEECVRIHRALGGAQEEPRFLCDASWEDLVASSIPEGSTLFKRARHVLTDTARTLEARGALEGGKLDELGALMFASHESLRTDFEVSCDELDAIVDDAARVDGVLGARLTGAGFGGCALILHERGVEDSLELQLQSRFRERFARDLPIWFFRSDRGPREGRRSS